jgi:multiple sugar transport system substrate-binding protein
MRTPLRTRAALAAALALSLALTACGSGGDTTAPAPDGGDAPAGEPVSISFLTHWGPDTVALLEAAVEDYRVDNPNVSVEIRAVPFGDLLTTVRAQTGSAAPTIAGIYDLWLPELVRDDLVAAAPDAVASDVRANWTPGVVDAATVGGSLYGVPNEINVYALNYHTDLLAEAGFDGPPATWDELAEMAEALTVREGGRITQQGFGMINSWAAGAVHPFASLIVSNGGELIVDGAPVLDSTEVGETFALVEALAGDVTDPTMGTADANTAGPFIDNFVSKKTAMIIMANWWESAIRTGMGDEAFANVATAPIPVGPSGDTARSISYSWMTVVSAQASEAEQAAAWDFLVWLNGPSSGEAGASAMGDILQSMGILPTRLSDVAAYQDRLDTAFLAGYVSVLESARPFPIVLGGQEFTEALQRQIEEVQFGRVSAADAQAAAQADAIAILERAAG